MYVWIFGLSYIASFFFGSLWLAKRFSGETNVIMGYGADLRMVDQFYGRAAKRAVVMVVQLTIFLGTLVGSIVSLMGLTASFYDF